MKRSPHSKLPLVMCFILGMLLAPVCASAYAIDMALADPDHKLAGANARDRAGWKVLFADVNGDGRDDIVVGAPEFDLPGRTGCGAVFIQLASDTMPPVLALDAPRDDILRIYGPAAATRLGGIMARGDVNGDGRDDIVCGIPSASPMGRLQAGELYVIPGTDMPTDTIDLQTPPPGIIHILGGAVFDKVGTAVAVGDVNGDAFGDIVAGAPLATTVRSLTGKVLVIHGGTTWPGVIDLLSPAVPVSQIYGQATNDYFGGAVGAADVTGDGIDDVLAGAPESSPLGRTRAGTSYIVRGRTVFPPTIDSIVAPDSGIVQIFGEENESASGSAFASGDYDGDLAPELALGAPEFGANSMGVVYLIDPAGAWPDTVDLTEPSAAARLKGGESNAKVGLRIATGDFDLDGTEDVLLGSPNARASIGRDESGKAYIVFGRVGFPPTIDLHDEQPGITHIYGAAAGDHLGSSVAAGNLDGDAFADILVGADGLDNPGEALAGGAYVIYGNTAITATAVLSFDAVPEGGLVRLSWEMTDAVGVAEIIIERRGPASRIARFGASDGIIRLAGRYTFLDSGVTPGCFYTYTVSTSGADPELLFRVSVSTPPAVGARLEAAYPNPFTTGATIPFWLPFAGRAEIAIYDVRGARVRVVADRPFDSGSSVVHWDGHGDSSTRLPSGVYFVRLSAGDDTFTRKLLLVK